MTGAERLERALWAVWASPDLRVPEFPPELRLPTGQEIAARTLDRRLRQLFRPDAVATAPTAADMPPELRDSELCTGPELQLQTAGVPLTDGGGTVAEAAAELGRNGRAKRQR